MWEWLAGLPLFWQIGLPTIAMIVVVVISIWGNAILKWGKRSIGFGRHKNSCSKCRQLIMASTLKYKADREIIEFSVLRDQMNYAEQKMHEVFLAQCRSYRDTIVKMRDAPLKIDQAREQKEYLLYQEALANSFVLIKNEVRRSLKENGFCNMSPVEYTHYCKEKAKSLITIAQEYIMSRYPFEKMIVPLQYRFKQLNVDEIESHVFSVVDRAKEIHNEAQEKLAKLDKEYDENIMRIANDD